MRRWVTALAILGVLLHAAMLVRHGVTRIGQEQQALTLSEAGPPGNLDFSLICHSPKADSASLGKLLPQGAPPAGNKDCPICSGLCAAAVMPAPLITMSLVLRLDFQHRWPPRDLRVETLKQVRPPGRGPPAFA